MLYFVFLASIRLANDYCNVICVIVTLFGCRCEIFMFRKHIDDVKIALNKWSFY